MQKLDMRKRQLQFLESYKGLFPFVDSAIEGYNGVIYVDTPINVTSAVIKIGVYTVGIGSAKDDSVALVKSLIKPRGWFVSFDSSWNSKLMSDLGGVAKVRTRYSTEFKSKGVKYYNEQISLLNSSFKIIKIDDEIAYNIESSWFKRLFGAFANSKDFLQNGVGYCVTQNGEIVAGASSHSVTSKGVEFQVMTHKDYENQHLAQSVSSQLILYCLGNRLTPFWEAANKVSLHVAEKLGFSKAKEY